MSDRNDRNGPLCRPQFFDRQDLKADDLNCLVEYVRARIRRHNRHLVGWGVVCGLEVDRVEASPWLVRVRSGFAVMPSGEEVAVPEAAEAFDTCAEARACLDIPGPCPTPFDIEDRPDRPASARPGGPIDFGALGGDVIGPNPLAIRWARIAVTTASAAPGGPTRTALIGRTTGLDLGTRTRIDLEQPVDALQLTLVRGEARPVVAAFDATGAEVDRQAPTGALGQPETLLIEGRGIARVEVESAVGSAVLAQLEIVPTARGNVYLVLCPAEEPSGFRPGVPEHCRPAGNNMFHSRVCETHRLRVLCTLPERSRPDCESLRSIVCGPEHVSCGGGADPAAGDCVVIAELTIGDDGILAVDEFTHRRRLLPQWLVSDLEACRCESGPPPTSSPPPTLPTIFTRPTEPTLFTDFTFATLFTRPTLFTDFTLATLFTDFTQLTLLTGPTLFTGITLPSLLVPIGPGGGPFDARPGERLELEIVSGIGGARAARLRDAGVNNLADFVTRSSETLARLLGVSEVGIAGMQDEARSLIERNR